MKNEKALKTPDGILVTEATPHKFALAILSRPGLMYGFTPTLTETGKWYNVVLLKIFDCEQVLINREGIDGGELYCFDIPDFIPDKGEEQDAGIIEVVEEALALYGETLYVSLEVGRITLEYTPLR